MKLRNVILLAIILTMSACVNQSSDGITSITVKEVEQVAAYTYMLVKDKGPEYWIAVPTMNAKPGDKYQYQGGMLMEDFYSKDLDRTFEKVIFLETLFSDEQVSPHAQEMTPGSQAIIEKSNVSVEKIEGTVTIAEIYADPASFEGKTIRVGGEVTKFNEAIMDRNWVHLQDGTEYEGKFDLTVTSNESFEVGSKVAVEGVLAINIDFGYGYSYEVLLEKATALN